LPMLVWGFEFYLNEEGRESVSGKSDWINV